MSIHLTELLTLFWPFSLDVLPPVTSAGIHFTLEPNQLNFTLPS